MLNGDAAPVSGAVFFISVIICTYYFHKKKQRNKSPPLDQGYYKGS